MTVFFRRLSVQLLVPFVTMSAVGFAGGTAAFLWLQDHELRAALAAESSALAAVTASNCQAAMSFSDEASAQQTLSSLAEHPQVVAAWLLDSEDQPFAAFSRLASAPQAPSAPTLGARFTKAGLEVTAPVVLDGRRLGTITILSQTTHLDRIWQAGLTLGTSLLVGLLAVVALLSWGARRAVTGPLTRLARAASAISRDRDYSRRVHTSQKNEIGELHSAFNDMLAQIQQRDEALRLHRDDLERQVDLRTAELREAVTQAQQAARAKAEFLATMSHEIRTPMNGVVGVAQMLLGTTLTEEQRDLAETIAHSGDNLLVVINDILDFSRVDAGRITLEHLAFDLSTVVEETAGLLAERAARKGLELVVDLGPTPPGTVLGDAARLRQILTNLVGNAVKFTERGTVTVSVELEPGDEPARHVCIAVADTGVGIAPSALDRIFEPFTQADGSHARRFGGSGLGLAIARRLAQAMGGDITVASSAGTGSTFTLRVPFPRAAQADAPAAPTRQAVIVSGHAGGAAALANALARLGFEARTFAEPADAFEHIRSSGGLRPAGRPSLVFVDAQLPSGTAHEFARAMHAVPPLRRVPLVLLDVPGAESPRGDEAQRFVATLRKPVKRSALARVCEQALAGRAVKLTSQDDRAHSDNAFRGRRVLVAEDNPVNLKVTTRMLQRLGCEFDVAENGLAALAHFRAQAYDLVLMDCQMPELDGLEATRRLRSEEQWRHDAAPRRIPVVALTANAMPGDREACLAAGMDDYLSKPVQLTALRATLARWIQPSADAIDVEHAS